MKYDKKWIANYLTDNQYLKRLQAVIGNNYCEVISSAIRQVLLPSTTRAGGYKFTKV